MASTAPVTAALSFNQAELSELTVPQLREIAQSRFSREFPYKARKADIILSILNLAGSAGSAPSTAAASAPLNESKTGEPKIAESKTVEPKTVVPKTVVPKTAVPKSEQGTATKKVATPKANSGAIATQPKSVVSAKSVSGVAIAETELADLKVAELHKLATDKFGLSFTTKARKADIIAGILVAAETGLAPEKSAPETAPPSKGAPEKSAAGKTAPEKVTPKSKANQAKDKSLAQDESPGSAKAPAKAKPVVGSAAKKGAGAELAELDDELEDEDEYLTDDEDDDIEDDFDDEDEDDEDDEDEDDEDEEDYFDDGIDDELLAATPKPDEEEEEPEDVVDFDTAEPDEAELSNELVLEEVVLAEIDKALESEGDAFADLPIDESEDEESETVTPDADKAGAEDESFIVSDKDEDDAPAQQVVTAGATADPVKDYLKQIGKVALLNAEQEVELAKRIEAGLYAEHTIEIQFPNFDRHKADLEARRAVRDLGWVVKDGKEAKNHLLEANLRLVVSLAKRYTGRGMLFLDLIQEGNLGLIRAVEKFDYTKGYKFSTYATWWIRQAITRAMADQARTIRIPVHMVEVINKLARVQRQMLQDLGREPTPEELAHELDMTPEKVVEVQKYGREPISLHTPLGEDGDSEFGDLIEDSEAVVPSDAVSFTLLQDQLRQVLETLSEREGGVVAMRFGLQDGQPKTLDEIGKVYGVTRERIRQIESKTMSKLRHPSRSQVLRDYLD